MLGGLERRSPYGVNYGRNERIILGAWDKEGDDVFLCSREGGQGEADEADGCGMHGYAVGVVSVLLRLPRPNEIVANERAKRR